MRDGRDAGYRGDRVEVVRISDARSARRPFVGIAAVLVAAAGILAAGALGDGEQPPAPTVAPRANGAMATPGTPRETATPGADASVAPTARRTSIRIGDGESDGTFFSVWQAGYRVAYQISEDQRPETFESGLRTIYPFPRDGIGAGGRITISVGTQTQGPSLVALDIARRLGTGRADGAVSRLLELVGGEIRRSTMIAVDGAPTHLLRLATAASSEVVAVALFPQGNRTFLVAATGFGGDGGDSDGLEAERALEDFLRGFRFGPALFVDRNLGFEVAMPLDRVPFGVSTGPREQPLGVFVFDDAQDADDERHSHQIAVSVGSSGRPAFVRSLPSPLLHPSTRRIWAATLPELGRQYLAAVAPWGRMRPEPIVIDGREALRLIGADGLAETILAVNDGKVYIISTTGTDAIEPAPHLEEFLDSFAFLE